MKEEEREAPPFSNQKKRKDGPPREEIEIDRSRSAEIFVRKEKEERVINVVFRNDEAFPSRARKEKNDINRVPCSF